MLVLPPGVKPTLNVFAYNIAEQTTTEGLNKVADTIASRHPDIILLNEVNVQNGGIEPIKYLQQRLGYPHSNYQVTTHTGWTGTKGIGIISRYQASSVQYYETTIPSCTVTTFCPQFGIAQYTIAINGLQHEIFSVRHAPMHAPSDSSYHWSEVPLNQAGHQLSKGLAASIPSDHVVIMGGDFNAAWDKSWAVNFRDTSGLTDTLLAHPDPLMAETFYTRKDYIYYRGPYSTDYAELRYGVQGASDHPYSQAILKRADSGPFPL
jgi:endonuclease/exonuclease/phosphatase family metal-dependent hydrolase